MLIRRKTENNELTLKYLQNLGGSIFNQIKSIGCSEAKIYEDDTEIIKQVCLGVLLSSYKFDNYKNVKIYTFLPAFQFLYIDFYMLIVNQCS